MLPATLCMLGDFLYRVDMRDDAEFYYRKAIKVEPQYRDGYIKLAQLLAYQPRPQEVYQVLDEMTRKSKYIEDWRLTTYYWKDWKTNQIIADAKCWEQKYQEAAQYMQKAIDSLKTDDDIADAKRENLFVDAKFIEDKLNSSSASINLFQTK